MDLPSLSLNPAVGVAGGLAEGTLEPQPALPAPAPEQPSMSAADALTSLNDSVQMHSTSLEFSIDASTHTQVFVVRDTQTGEVLLQCPSEEALRMARNLEGGVGGLVDTLV